MKVLMFQKELMWIKQVCQKNVCFAIIGFLTMLDSNLKSMFVMDVMILLTMDYSLENIAILSAKGATLRCILWGISRNEGLRRLNNSVLEDKGVL